MFGKTEKKKNYKKLYEGMVNDMSFILNMMQWIMETKPEVYSRYLEMKTQIDEQHELILAEAERSEARNVVEDV